jgi:uncharacterized membrane protein YkoI
MIRQFCDARSSAGNLGHSRSMISPPSLRWVAAAAILVATLTVVRADEDADHDLVRDLHERGEILSFEQIAQAAHQVVPGDIVGVALQRNGRGWTYVIRIVDAAGHRVTLDVDAESAKLLSRSPTSAESP